MNIPFPWFVFDVESVGLFGDPFAVGWVVIDKDGQELESYWFGFDYNKVHGGSIEAFDWCENNIPPHILKGTSKSINFVYEDFARNLGYWQKKGASIISDVPFPVESNFLLLLFQRG